jgi:iron complex transport system ATP-binding protein
VVTGGEAAVLELRGLEFGYEALRPVLRGVDLRLAPSEFLVVLGPNGAGKSTLVRCAAGHAAPWTGDVRLCGAALGSFRGRERARRLAVVPQRLERVPPVRVREFVESGRYAHLRGFRRAGSEDRAAVERALREVDLLGRESEALGELSGGQLQRALIARALAQEPQVLLVDEPTSSLDLAHQLSVFELIAGLSCRGRAVLCVTHDLNLASQFATRLVLLREGRVVAEGRPEQVLRPEVLVPIYGPRLRFGELPGPAGKERRPWVLPWAGDPP